MNMHEDYFPIAEARTNQSFALFVLLERYVSLVNSGDCGCWDPESEEEVINARAALGDCSDLEDLRKVRDFERALKRLSEEHGVSVAGAVYAVIDGKEKALGNEDDPE